MQKSIPGDAEKWLTGKPLLCAAPTSLGQLRQTHKSYHHTDGSHPHPHRAKVVPELKGATPGGTSWKSAHPTAPTGAVPGGL